MWFALTCKGNHFLLRLYVLDKITDSLIYISSLKLAKLSFCLQCIRKKEKLPEGAQRTMFILKHPKSFSKDELKTACIFSEKKIVWKLLQFQPRI